MRQMQYFRRTGVLLDPVKIFLRHFSGGERTHRLERAHDRELFDRATPAVMSRERLLNSVM
jgi:hypothetical protein